MDALRTLVTRDDGNNNEEGLTPTMVNLLISLLVLILFGLSLVGALLVLRRKRQNRSRSELPIHNGQCKSNPRYTITSNGKTESVFVYDEKRNLIENSSSPPSSPVPEIRITFPEEEDEAGKRKSGRVVVVRISETGGVGLEPCHEDLPPYQSNDAERFQSLDLERMGGLKEKQDAKRWS
ncbi:hypothetical protein DTO166G4_1464 [Paecilomyces variotii]|uniref:Uncharacterized protein n=1 Tax=Byssochlamys spectabilis TaxID=264951 RepID=A0A443HM80_BYSSP|nr:hypothetical protein C8Q69DRAFT_75354 [Paecilomyces variotii]KAJ9200537.1 hypothetical protein DTO164E3_4112 [Paecilomyces variotii]KAJ9208340.1 hypothetical protein DTO032I3_1011 [Paecilomyces variotii]KAJ9217004.1 hypothetical protein DTO166G4_1464 [Paecilomyces variotii]KAJ9226174.1 hypothetical protein DTO169C6_1387 [Paecilomyces variotii]KAJ9237600.1 hypothetical protein DTO169E5_5186 [Paecilomyces variotii]